MDQVSGIYMIKNTLNNKIYIGQSSDIYNRWIKHINFLKSNKHHNRHLQSAWNKYGQDAFEFSIVEECDCDKLDLAEQHWIKYYSSYEHGYNLDLGGGGIRGYKHTELELEKMVKVHNSLSVLQFDTNFNLIAEWASITTAAKKLGYTRDSIRCRCDNDKVCINWKKEYKNCYWVYRAEYESKDFSWEENLKWKSKFSHPKKRTRVLKEPIYQYDTNFNFIKKWNNANDIVLAGFNIDIITRMCNQTGNKKRYKNSVWAYESYDFSDNYFVISQPSHAHNAVKVEQYSLDGEYIQTFDSIRDASLSVSGHTKGDSCIIQALKTNGTSYGYRWKRAK